MDFRDKRTLSGWIIGLLATLYTGFVLLYSIQHGRLLYDIDYEDVITFVDGAKRLLCLEERGLAGYWAYYLWDPPHAPLHSTMATISFAVLGRSDWAPYVSNVLVVAVWFSLVTSSLLEVSASLRLLLLLFAATAPLSFLSAHEFRPDFPAALFAACGIAIFLRHLIEPANRRRQILAGLCFGLSLLSKPTVFPYSLSMAGSCVIAGYLFRMAEARKFLWPFAYAKGLWPFAAAPALLCFPHYYVAFARLREYIFRNVFGKDKEIWALKGGLREQLLYHVNGYSGRFMLGQNLPWLALAIAGGLAAAVALRHSQSKLRSLFLLCCLMTLPSYFFVAINHVEGPYFGLTFQMMVVLDAVLGLALLASFPKAFRAWPWQVLRLLPVLFLVVGCRLVYKKVRHMEAHMEVDPAVKRFGQFANRVVLDTLARWRPKADNGEVFLTAYGALSSHTLQWMTFRDGARNEYTTLPNNEAVEASILRFTNEQEAPRSDFLLVAEEGAYGLYDFLPTAKTTGKILEWLRGGQRLYTEVRTVRTPSGKDYHLFMREPNFGGWDRATGLGPLAGPYDIYERWVTRFRKQPAREADPRGVTLEFDAEAAGAATLEVRTATNTVPKTMTVFANGNRLAELECGLGKVAGTKIEVPAVEGKNRVELRFGSQGNGDSGGVVLEQLRIRPPGCSNLVEFWLRGRRTPEKR